MQHVSKWWWCSSYLLCFLDQNALYNFLVLGKVHFRIRQCIHVRIKCCIREKVRWKRTRPYNEVRAIIPRLASDLWRDWNLDPCFRSDVLRKLSWVYHRAKKRGRPPRRCVLPSGAVVQLENFTSAGIFHSEHSSGSLKHATRSFRVVASLHY